MIQCRISTDSDVYALFSPESPIRAKRAELKVSKGKTVDIDIAAEDLSSFKSLINSVIKTLETNEKIQELK